MEQRKTEYEFFPDLDSATGEIPFGMTNDYMFRAVLQTNNVVLRGLLGALLHLPQEEMISVEITNPIIVGEAIDNKEFRLDINVLLNNNNRINLEMQVENLYNWVNRSLSYLCRSFDKLVRGQDYSEVVPVIHIGILDYTLFPEVKEFYAQYKMMNARNHHVYSDNFLLNVLDLNQVDIATKEDKEYKLDYWAKLFKMRTWEELKQMGMEDNYFKEATKTIFTLSAEEEVRKRCRDREDYYADLRGMQKMIDEKDVLLEKQELQLEEQNALIGKQQEQLGEKDTLLNEQQEEIARLRAELLRLGQGAEK